MFARIPLLLLALCSFLPLAHAETMSPEDSAFLTKVLRSNLKNGGEIRLARLTCTWQNVVAPRICAFEGEMDRDSFVWNARATAAVLLHYRAYVIEKGLATVTVTDLACDDSLCNFQ